MIPSNIFCSNCGAANQAQDSFCFACGQPLRTGPAATYAPRATSPATGLLVPSDLLKQRYRIRDLIGQGGMAAVYKAEDTLFNDRLVAVKEMSQGGLSPKEVAEGIETFKREAHMLAELSHQSLPKIHDYFTDAGRWYLVMDFIDGDTLENYVSAKGGKLPAAEAVGIGIWLAEALNYLHHRQSPIIFRDLKPSNIMRKRDGHIFLIDFGIARHFKPGQVKDTIPFGSAGYAAPEQYGKAQTTPRSDIYSLGAVLHQLLTGDDPSLTPFKFAPIANRVHTVSANLEKLIVHMVEMDADKRPESMAIVKDELQYIATKLVEYNSPLPKHQSVAVLAASRQPVAHSSSAKRIVLPQSRQASITRRVVLGLVGLAVVGIAGGEMLQKMFSQIATSFPSSSTDMPSSSTGSMATETPVSTIPASSMKALLFTYHGHSTTVNSVAWSPNGKRIASGSSDNTVQIWDATNGNNGFTYRGHTSFVESVVWSPDSKRIASGSYDNSVQVWDATNGNNIFHAVSYGVSALAWSPNGKRIASSTEYWLVQVWDATNGNDVFTYNGHSASVNAVTWSPDSKRIASGSADNTVQTWNAVDGSHVLTYRGHYGGVNAVTWSPNGKLIASGASDTTVQIWDAVDGNHVFTYDGHTDIIFAVAWSPDGKRIASASRDMTVQVWDAADGSHVFTYRGHSGSVNSVVWSSDGKLIASGSDDGTVQVWWAVERI